MKSMILLLLALSADAFACGGPDYRELDAALVPVDHHVAPWLYGDDWNGTDRADVARFLHSFPADATDEVAPARAAFDKALAAGDREAATKAAQALVEAILDLSVEEAEPHGEALRLAVEWLEVAPTLGKAPQEAVAAWFAGTSASTSGLPAELRAVSAVRTTTPEAASKMRIDPKHPRAASLRWLALRHALVTGVPDGWSAEDIRAAAPKGFGDLQEQLDAWLEDYPSHPLADYVRLKKVRLHYLSGESDAAWAILLDRFEAHPDRIANEMRFLVKQGAEPTRIDLTKVRPEIAGGLAERATPEEWDALWKRTEAEKDAAWALPVQERLLLAASRWPAGTALPAAFPKDAASPTPAWAVLRFVALEHAGRADEAWAQLEKIDPAHPVAAPARARLLLAKGDWVGAIRAPGLDPAAMRYLVRVLAPEEAVRALIDDENPEIRFEARLALASADVAEGVRWKTAAKWLAPVDPGRVALWKQADGLARKKSPDDVLAYARFLRENGGVLLAGNDYEDVVWYRSLPVAWKPEPGTFLDGREPLGITAAQEWEGTEAWLKRSWSTWYSVEAYARYLSALEVDQLDTAELTDARIVLGEVDHTYNLLLNYGSGEYAWAGVLPQSEPAKQIRRVGKELRAKAP